MSRPPIDQTAWQPWIDHVCEALDIDASLVDVAALHGLAGEVASRFTRPMAPVSAHLWGLAVGAGQPEARAHRMIVDAAAAAGDADAVR